MMGHFNSMLLLRRSSAFMSGEKLEISQPNDIQTGKWIWNSLLLTANVFDIILLLHTSQLHVKQ